MVPRRPLPIWRLRTAHCVTSRVRRHWQVQRPGCFGATHPHSTSRCSPPTGTNPGANSCCTAQQPSSHCYCTEVRTMVRRSEEVTPPTRSQQTPSSQKPAIRVTKETAEQVHLAVCKDNTVIDIESDPR